MTCWRRFGRCTAANPADDEHSAGSAAIDTRGGITKGRDLFHFRASPVWRMTCTTSRVMQVDLKGNSIPAGKGQYRRARCRCRYAVRWERPGAGRARVSPGAPTVPCPFARIFLVAAVAFAALPLRAADVARSNPNSAAAGAFARYVTRLDEAHPWAVEAIDIQASLPHMGKRGQMRAIRRLLPFGQVDYRILQISGDHLVRQQVLARYLTADMHASEIPAASVAVTPANYKFRYIGLVTDAGSLAYAFQVTPRKKREGLIKGELWLDSKTGLAIRQSGNLVKNLSIFIKRVTVTREISLHDGAVAARITHLSVDTWIAGRAELLIEERPVADGPGSQMSDASER